MDEYKEIQYFHETNVAPALSLDKPIDKDCALLIARVHEIAKNILNASSFEEASTLFNAMNNSYYALFNALQAYEESGKIYDLRDLYYSSIKLITCDGIPLDLLQYVIQCLCFLFDKDIVSSEIEPDEEISERVIFIIHSGFDSLFTDVTQAAYLPAAIDLLGYLITDSYVADIIQEMHDVFYRLPFNSKKSILLFYSRIVMKYKECISDLQAKDIISDDILFIKSCTIAIDQNDVSIEILLCKIYIYISSSWNIDPIDENDIQLMSWIDYIIKVRNISIIWKFLIALIERNQMVAYSLGTTLDDLNKIAIHNHDYFLFKYIEYIIDRDLVDCSEFRKLFDHIITKYSFLKHYGILYRFIVTYICKADSYKCYNIVFNTALDESIFVIFQDALDVYDFINDDYTSKIIQASIAIFNQFLKSDTLTSDIEGSFNDLADQLIDISGRNLHDELLEA